MDNAQEQEWSEIQPSAAVAAPTSENVTSPGDQVREVRGHLERASAALAALDQLLPAGNQPVDEADGRGHGRSEQ